MKKEDERNIVTPTPMELKEATPVLANSNKCTANLHYTLDGVRGHLLVESPEDGVSIILASDLEDNLQQIDYKEEKADKRANKAARYTPFQYGMCQGWKVPGTMTISTYILRSLCRNAEMIDNFLGLFDGDKCKIPWEAMRIFTAFASSNHIRRSTAAL